MAGAGKWEDSGQIGFQPRGFRAAGPCPLPPSWPQRTTVVPEKAPNGMYTQKPEGKGHVHELASDTIATKGEWLLRILRSITAAIRPDLDQNTD